MNEKLNDASLFIIYSVQCCFVFYIFFIKILCTGTLQEKSKHNTTYSFFCRLVYCLLEIKSLQDAQTQRLIIPKTNEASSMCEKKTKKKKSEKYLYFLKNKHPLKL